MIYLYLMKYSNIEYQLLFEDEYFEDNKIIYYWKNVPKNFVLNQLTSEIKGHILSGEKCVWRNEDIEKLSYTNLTIFNKSKEEIIDLLNRTFNTLK